MQVFHCQVARGIGIGSDLEQLGFPCRAGKQRGNMSTIEGRTLHAWSLYRHMLRYSSSAGSRLDVSLVGIVTSGTLCPAPFPYMHPSCHGYPTLIRCRV